MRRRLPPLRSLLSVPLVALLCAPMACSLPAQARPLVDLAVIVIRPDAILEAMPEAAERGLTITEANCADLIHPDPA